MCTAAPLFELKWKRTTGGQLRDGQLSRVFLTRSAGPEAGRQPLHARGSPIGWARLTRLVWPTRRASLVDWGFDESGCRGQNAQRRPEMNLSNLSTMEIALIVCCIVLVGGVLVYLLQKRRTAHLRQRFGESEYETAVIERGGRRQAEAVLDERAKRVESFHLRALTPADRARFMTAWAQVQAHFVDMPAGAVAEADQLLGDVMATRGYPVGDFEQRAADISVDHPLVTQNYRAAHTIALSHLNGQASTEDLRRAMIHYRALFEELVREPAAVVGQSTVPESRVDYETDVALRARKAS